MKIQIILPKLLKFESKHSCSLFKKSPKTSELINSPHFLLTEDSSIPEHLWSQGPFRVSPSEIN